MSVFGLQTDGPSKFPPRFTRHGRNWRRTSFLPRSVSCESCHLPPGPASAHAIRAFMPLTSYGRPSGPSNTVPSAAVDATCRFKHTCAPALCINGTRLRCPPIHLNPIYCIRPPTFPTSRTRRSSPAVSFRNSEELTDPLYGPGRPSSLS